MPAISFQGEWLDKLLSGTKQQTTRPQTDRIKVGDICTIYNQQRRKIINKPLRSLTDEGYGKMAQLSHRSQMNQYPAVPFTNPARQYPAHFLGKVETTEVYEIRPTETDIEDLEKWALADGFDTVTDADIWFTKRYAEEWVDMWWTVIRWDGWLERYFEAGGDE